METPSTSGVDDLSAAQCWALLRDTPIGRLALHGADGIEIFPINFIVDSGTVLFRSAHGLKLQLIGDGTACSFEADEIDVGQGLVWSVVLKGTAQPVRGQDAIVATFDMEVPTWQAGPKPIYVRMTPESISGRRFPVTPT